MESDRGGMGVGLNALQGTCCVAFRHARNGTEPVPYRSRLAGRFLGGNQAENGIMQFIEMSGKTLLRIVREEGPSPKELAEVGVVEESVVRINRQGDIEIRRTDRWDVIGGLLGDYEHRVKRETGLDWV